MKESNQPKLVITLKLAAHTIAALLIAGCFAGCAVRGNQLQVGRTQITGQIVQGNGTPAAHETLTIVRGQGMKPNRKEMDLLRGRAGKPEPTVRKEVVETDQGGRFELMFPGFAREEYVWLVPPYTLFEKQNPPNPTLLLLIETPPPDGHLYQIRGRKETALEVTVFDPAINRFRVPHRERESEEVAASLFVIHEPLANNPGYTQRVDQVHIQIRRLDQPALSSAMR